MSSSLLTNIFQTDTEILEQQQQEMQKKHKEEQRLQAYLKEVVEAYYIEMKKVTKAKTQKDAEK